MQIKLAKPDAFAIAGSVHDQTGNAARHQIRYAFEILNLLGDVETIKEHHRRDFAGAVRRLGMDINRRQAGSLIGYFHMLHPRPLEIFGGVAQTIHTAHIGIEAFLSLGLQETLADVIIGAGALQILRPTSRVTIRDAFAAAILHRSCLARPFAEPSGVVADPVLQAEPDPIDLAYFGAAPWRHVEPDQQTMRPTIVFREIREGQLLLRGM